LFGVISWTLPKIGAFPLQFLSPPPTQTQKMGVFEAHLVLTGLVSLILTEMTFGTAVTPSPAERTSLRQASSIFQIQWHFIWRRGSLDPGQRLARSYVARLAELTIACGREVLAHTHTHTHTHTLWESWWNIWDRSNPLQPIKCHVTLTSANDGAWFFQNQLFFFTVDIKSATTVHGFVSRRHGDVCPCAGRHCDRNHFQIRRSHSIYFNLFLLLSYARLRYSQERKETRHDRIVSFSSKV